MASFRKTTSATQRTGNEQEGNAGSVPTISPESSYMRKDHSFGHSSTLLDPTLAFDRLGAAILDIHLQRTCRPLERKKTTLCRRYFLHIFICFVVGSLVGITPFLSVDIGRNFVPKHQVLSFKLDQVVDSENSVTKPTMEMGHQFELNDPEVVRNLSSMIWSKWMPENEDTLSSNTTLSPENTLSSNTTLPPYIGFTQQKLLIIVTPIYPRSFQAYYLNRLAHTLRNVPPPLLWIVVEMSQQSIENAEMLRGTGVMYRHLVCQKNITNIKDQAAHQRNVALAHIEKHQLDGIVYFADDHNIYALELFDQLREIRRLGTWPVALLNGNEKSVVLQGPVCNGTYVIGWHTSDISLIYRRFHSHISGFAFNSTILWDSKRWHRPTPDLIRQSDTGKKGSQVSTLLEQLVEDESQMEGLPIGCSEIMVWSLDLEAPMISDLPVWSILLNLGNVMRLI